MLHLLLCWVNAVPKVRALHVESCPFVHVYILLWWKEAYFSKCSWNENNYVVLGMEGRKKENKTLLSSTAQWLNVTHETHWAVRVTVRITFTRKISTNKQSWEKRREKSHRDAKKRIKTWENWEIRHSISHIYLHFVLAEGGKQKNKRKKR